jgi:hypothetical protein
LGISHSGEGDSLAVTGEERTMSKPKIGQRAKWSSLDESIPTTFGRVTQVSPSGTRVEITWDEDGESYSYDLNAASMVRLLK